MTQGRIRRAIGARRRELQALFLCGGILAGLGLGGQAGAQEKQATPLWLMDGCRAALRDPTLGAPPGTGDDPARVSATAQSQACVSSIQSILTVGTTSGAFCPPAGTTAMDAVAVVVPYVDAHPVNDPSEVRGRVSEAMGARWPCH
jgi:hypothetical protein